MAMVNVRIPSLLAELADGRLEHPVEAGTVGGALSALFEQFPQLRVHVFDETGAVRQHVSCFHNGRHARTVEAHAAPLAEGDTVTILQAVSGG
jgi:molybdopterin synthase sulfur carrier subunit